MLTQTGFFFARGCVLHLLQYNGSRTSNLSLFLIALFLSRCPVLCLVQHAYTHTAEPCFDFCLLTCNLVAVGTVIARIIAFFTSFLSVEQKSYSNIAAAIESKQ